MLQEIRHAWRAIRKMPVVATVIVVSLAIGIGVNAAIFSWVQAVILQPLPGVPDAGGFYAVEPRAETGSYPGVSWLEYQDLRERLTAFPDLIAFRMMPFNVGEPGQARRGYGLLVSGNYFSALQLRPALGRFFGPDDVKVPGREPVVVVSHDYWQTHLGGDPQVVGRTIRLNDNRLTIIGVAPPKFQGTILSLSFDLFVPATLAPSLVAGSRELADRSLRGYTALGRIPTVPMTRAQSELEQVMRELGRLYPETDGKMQAEVVPFWQATRGPQRMLAGALLMLQGVLLLLLFAVCGNTANLLLARASARYREMGVRLALGAGRWRIARLMLIENVMLAVAGAAIGAIIAAWASGALRAVPFITAFPVKFQTSLDGFGLTFTMTLGILCGVIFGIVPALQLAGIDPQAALHSGARTSGKSGLRNILMGTEVGLALIVLLAAALFLRSFSETKEVDPGFKREGVLLAAYDFAGRNVDGPFARDFARRLLERLRALPDVEFAAIASSVPLDIHGFPMRPFTLEGRTRSDGTLDTALTNTVTPGYFGAMAIPFRQGRDFADLADTSAPAQAVVNEEFVRRFVGGADPIGRRLRSRNTDYVIAGVVRNSLSESFSEPPTPVIYTSYRERPSARGEIHVRTRTGAETLLGPQIERVVRDLDPELPVYDIRTLTDHVEKNLFLRRIPARIFVVLGPVLLGLAAIGIYAVVAYTVSQRTKEIGVRLALGATANGVVRRILAETLRIVATGALIGWALFLAVELHLVRGPIYLSVFIGVPLLLMVVAALACWVPARRAATVDPMVALRQE
jgi:macrolide transport system ATP-binding/permease protein